MKHLYAIDYQEYPGKALLRYVEFSEEIVPQESPVKLADKYSRLHPSTPGLATFLGWVEALAVMAQRAEKEGGE